MSEIEKMYENAEVKKQIPKVCSSNELYCKECKAHIEDAMPYCKNAEYPPFTANKQLELIKKLGNINIDIDNGCYMSSEILKVEAHCDTFEETLAEFVNNLWQDLTETERNEIKEILQ